ncbi:MAG: DNA-directed RNA polymerase subunit alpha [Pirellulales bacterium]|nr:DNA-directed RNA polymerase subunit alpha [Pirellulales bacterium]
MAVTRIPIPAWARTQKADDRLELSLAEIDLTVRTVNCLEEERIFTVVDLLQCTRERLLQITNLGEKTVETIYVALEKLGFYRGSQGTAGDAVSESFALLNDQEEIADIDASEGRKELH